MNKKVSITKTGARDVLKIELDLIFSRYWETLPYGGYQAADFFKSLVFQE